MVENRLRNASGKVIFEKLLHYYELTEEVIRPMLNVCRRNEFGKSKFSETCFLVMKFRVMCVVLEGIISFFRLGHEAIFDFRWCFSCDLVDFIKNFAELVIH